MKKEYIDILYYDKEYQEYLESKGYILTGQIGGGEADSCMIFSLPENEEERIIAQEQHDKQVAWAKEYWEAFGGRR